MERDAMTTIQTERLKEYIVKRQAQTFADHGVEEDAVLLIDRMTEIMQSLYPAYTIDELLLRPRHALLLCDAIRQATGYADLPDDIILRPILNRRKNP
jgi:hypothetical protein